MFLRKAFLRKAFLRKKAVIPTLSAFHPSRGVANPARPRALQAAEKLGTGGAIDEKHASGAEARIDFAALRRD
jgi:hypothetical protein